MTGRVFAKTSFKWAILAIGMSLMLAACGSDDSNDEAGGQNAPVTPTQASAQETNPAVQPGAQSTSEDNSAQQGEQPGSGNVQPGVIAGQGSAQQSKPEITYRKVEATPGQGQGQPRRGSDGSMSNQALGTPSASPGASPAASPAASPESTPEASEG